LKHYLIVKGVKRKNEHNGNNILSLFYISLFLKEDNIIKTNIVSNNHDEFRLTLMEWFIIKLGSLNMSVLLIINKIGYTEIYIQSKTTEPFKKVNNSQIEKNCVKIYDSCWLNDMIVIVNQNLEIIAFNPNNQIILFKYMDSNNLFKILKMNPQKSKNINPDYVYLMRNEKDVS
jgi:hypothetical protein